MKKQIILAVANQIQNMMYNDITCENGVESFECWCNDGEVFENEGMDEADAKECMQLVKVVAPLVDNLVMNHLNIDNPAAVSVKKEDAEQKNELFVRLGIYIQPTDEETDKILKGDVETMQQVIREHRYTIGGDTYLPSPAIEIYNEQHGTDYTIDDIGFEQYDWCE